MSLDLFRRRVVERDDDVEGLVAELREGMRLIERKWREDRVDLVAEIGVGPLTSRRR